MKFEKDTSGIKRYIAFDIHKEYALVGGQNAQLEWVMAPRRVGSCKPAHRGHSCHRDDH
jgi:hypothetical protein